MVQEQTAPTRASKAVRPTPQEIWVEEHADVQETVNERVSGSSGELNTYKHTTAKLQVVYFPTTWGWESREVPSTNVRLVIGAGARYNCGDCNGDCAPDPRNPQYNNCPGRPKFATMQCPMCGKLVYDFDARSVNADLLQGNNPSRTADADGTLIEDPIFATSTPTMRLTATLTNHMLRYHPEAAFARGLGREGSAAEQAVSAAR